MNAQLHTVGVQKSKSVPIWLPRALLLNGEGGKSHACLDTSASRPSKTSTTTTAAQLACCVR